MEPYVNTQNVLHVLHFGVHTNFDKEEQYHQFFGVLMIEAKVFDDFNPY
jgi:hypothetical protein